MKNELLDALNNLGICILDNKGNYRSFYDVFDELSSKWSLVSRKTN